jgi:hypothetical protein
MRQGDTMARKYITESSWKALEEMVKRGRLHAYELVRSLYLKWPTAQDAIRRLLNGKLIRYAGEEPGEKKRIRRIYVPTEWGMLLVLGETVRRGNWEAVREIARSNAHLWPPVLGKWEYFEKKGVGEEARERLKMVCRWIPPAEHWDERSGTRDPKEALEGWTEEFFGLYPWYGKREKRLEWCRAIREDPELHELVTAIYRKIVEEQRLALERYENYLNDLESQTRKREKEK